MITLDDNDYIQGGPQYGVVLSIEEVRALYDELKDQWINRDNPLVLKILEQMGNFLDTLKE